MTTKRRARCDDPARSSHSHEFICLSLTAIRDMHARRWEGGPAWPRQTPIEARPGVRPLADLGPRPPPPFWDSSAMGRVLQLLPVAQLTRVCIPML